MKLELMMQDNYRDGRAEGLAEGKAEAEAKAKEKEASMIKDLYARNVPFNVIAECAHLSASEVKAIISAK